MEEILENTERENTGANVGMRKQTKSNPAIIVALVIFVLASLGLGTYIALDKTVLHKDEACINNGSNAETQEEVTTPGTPQTIPVADNTVNGEAKKSSYMIEGSKNSRIIYSNATNKYYLEPKKDGSDDIAVLTFAEGDEPGTKMSLTDTRLSEDGMIGFVGSGDANAVSDVLVYELDFENVSGIYSVEYGQQWTGDVYAIVMLDGSMKMLRYRPGGYGYDGPDSVLNSAKVKIIDAPNINNVVSAQTVYRGSSFDTLITHKDGSNEYLGVEFFKENF